MVRPLLVLFSTGCCLVACSTPDMGNTPPSSPSQEEASAQDMTPDTEPSDEAPSEEDASEAPPAEDVDDAAEDTEGQAQPQGPLANVVQVDVQGSPGAYTFSVAIRSEETGCEQYADWWEVFTEDGQLLYRRILAHSHVSEQPFTRSGGPVPLDSPTTKVWVRAHMNPGGYGGQSMLGSPSEGFTAMDLGPERFSSLAQSQPLPSGCAF